MAWNQKTLVDDITFYWIFISINKNFERLKRFVISLRACADTFWRRASVGFCRWLPLGSSFISGSCGWNISWNGFAWHISGSCNRCGDWDDVLAGFRNNRFLLLSTAIREEECDVLTHDNILTKVSDEWSFPESVKFSIKVSKLSEMGWQQFQF